MRKAFGTLLVAMMVTIISGVVFAGPIEDGIAAYQRGDYETARDLFLPLAEQGDDYAQHALGVMYVHTQSYVEAAKWFALAANQGYVAAQIDLGIMYQDGQGVAQNYVTALMWFEIAITQKSRNARRAVEYHYLLAQKMTKAQIGAAEKLARKWKPTTKRAP